MQINRQLQRIQGADSQDTGEDKLSPDFSHFSFRPGREARILTTSPITGGNMTGKRHLIRALTGFGLAGALFMGCQDFFGQKSGYEPTPIVNQDPAELALRLTVKPTGACQDLRKQI